MIDTPELPVLADLMALKVDGPTTVILRPRRRLAHDEMVAIADGMKRIAADTKMNLSFVLVPEDFDIMAVGDAELERYGLTRLPTSVTR